MKFREQRGSLVNAMKTLVELPDRQALIEHCQKLLAPHASHFEPSALKVVYYGSDARINWDVVYIVTIDEYGVMGFTDSDC